MIQFLLNNTSSYALAQFKYRIVFFYLQHFLSYPPSQSFVANKGEVLAAFKLVLDKSLINSKVAERAVPKDFRILGEHHLWHSPPFTGDHSALPSLGQPCTQ